VSSTPERADLILHGGTFTTMDAARPFAEAVAIRAGRFVAVGRERDVMLLQAPATLVVDIQGKTAIPGLNDSHTHPIRGGLYYDLELRWDGVPSLAYALQLLREQAKRTPPPHWVRVVGGWTGLQFAERRLPTLEEINAAAPDTPVFVLHLCDRAWLNGAALRAVGYTRDTPDPPGGEIQRDRQGNPTGLLIARPNDAVLCSTLARGPRLSPEDQLISTRRFQRELNRLGVTSVIDAGGECQSYPDDYQAIEELARRGLLTTLIAYSLFPQRPGEELADFRRWSGMAAPRQGDDFYRHNGAGEMLVFSAADFENFLEPRPEMGRAMEPQLTAVVGHLVRNRWPFRIHATFDQTISRALDVFESVDREVPFDGLRFVIDHAETISPRSIERVHALGGGIAIQHRLAFQGEWFARRYGREAAGGAPPISRMLQMGVPVGAGTDGTRVATYNPFVCLSWLVTGKTIGGTALRPESNRLGRMEALRLWTAGSAWFSGDEGKKGMMSLGQLADLAVLGRDYFSVPDDQIKELEADLTILGGKVVHASGRFAALAPPEVPQTAGSPTAVGGPAGESRARRPRGRAASAWWSCACFDP